MAGVALPVRAALDDQQGVRRLDAQAGIGKNRAGAVEQEEVGLPEALAGHHQEAARPQHRHIGNNRIADDDRLGVRRIFDELRLVHLHREEVACLGDRPIRSKRQEPQRHHSKAAEQIPASLKRADNLAGPHEGIFPLIGIVTKT